MKESRESYSTYVNNLEGEYKDTFQKVEAYCDVILDYDIDTREEILSYILDDFLNAQKDNIPIQKIIGNDIIKYCDNTCSGISFKYHIKRYIKNIESYSYVILFFVLIDVFIAISKNNSIFDIKFNISIYLTSFIVMLLTSLVFFKIEKQIIKYRLIKNKRIKKYSQMSLLVFLIIILIITFMAFELVQKYTIISWYVPTLSVLIISILGIGLSKIIYRNDNKIKYYDISYLVDEEIKNNQKRFKKINNRNIKNKKELITESNYLKKAIKDYKNRRYYMSLGALISSIILCIEILPDYSIKIFFYQFCKMILLLLLTKCFFSYFEKVNKKVIEKFQFFIDNNISVDDWKK